MSNKAVFVQVFVRRYFILLSASDTPTLAAQSVIDFSCPASSHGIFDIFSIVGHEHCKVRLYIHTNMLTHMHMSCMTSTMDCLNI